MWIVLFKFLGVGFYLLEYIVFTVIYQSIEQGFLLISVRQTVNNEVQGSHDLIQISWQSNYSTIQFKDDLHHWRNKCVNSDNM